MPDTQMREDVRSQVQKHRRPPGARSGPAASVPFESSGTVQQVETPPAELRLNTTDGEGELAVWFDDAWWMELLGKWSDEPLTIHIEPTPGALMHPVVLHHIEMLRRVAPRWRVIGHGYLAEIGHSSSAATLARSCYHEVRIVDGPRPDAMETRISGHLSISELFRAIREEQQRLGTTRPVLTRVPPTNGETKIAS